MSAILVLGGAFNPVHLGHVYALKNAAAQVRQMGIDVRAAYFSCASDDYCKKKYGNSFIAGEYRLSMCNIIAAGDGLIQSCPRLFDSAKECGKALLAAEHPPDTQIFIVSGSDRPPRQKRDDLHFDWVCVSRRLNQSGRDGVSATQVRDLLSSSPEGLAMAVTKRLLPDEVAEFLATNPQALVSIVSASDEGGLLQGTIPDSNEEDLAIPMTRKDIAEETMCILETALQGSEDRTPMPEILQAIDGEKSFSEMVAAAVAGSEWHPEDNGRRPLPKIGPDIEPCEVEFAHETTLSCILRLHGQGHVVALNFASAINPGGGFLGGAEAQEESLARSSGLYPCLDKFRDSHYSQPLNKSCYTHSMIFSPNVPFFRDDDGNLQKPVGCSIITSAACNTKRIKDNRQVAEATRIMKERVRWVFHLAAAEYADVLILGAWGCGVFGGDPQQMANVFRQIVQDSKFRHMHCIFAIPDIDTLNIFQAVFDGREIAPWLIFQPQFARPEKRWKGKPHRERRVRDDREVATANSRHF